MGGIFWREAIVRPQVVFFIVRQAGQMIGKLVEWNLQFVLRRVEGFWSGGVLTKGLGDGMEDGFWS